MRLVCFVVGAVIAARVTGMAYGFAFADEDWALGSGYVAVGYIVATLIGGSAEGFVAAASLSRVLSHHPPSQRP